MTVTTIKVSSSTRDKINALAAEQGLTAGSLVEKVLEDSDHLPDEGPTEQVRDPPRMERAVSGT